MFVRQHLALLKDACNKSSLPRVDTVDILVMPKVSVCFEMSIPLTFSTKKNFGCLASNILMKS